MSKIILLAEDDEDNRDLMEFVIARSGLDVTMYTAENGQQAVQMAQAYKPVLILMDMQMPVMDGYTATREIRKWEQATSVETPLRIIALTAHALRDDAQRSIEAGCDAHLTKPIKKAILLETILQYTKDKVARPQAGSESA